MAIGLVTFDVTKVVIIIYLANPANVSITEEEITMSKEQKVDPRSLMSAFLKEFRENGKKEDIMLNKLKSWAQENNDCLSCGSCCKNHFSFTNPNDYKQISKAMGISLADFKKKYTISRGNGEVSLNCICPCLDTKTNECKIYEQRPDTCRFYPFGVRYCLEKVIVWDAENVCKLAIDFVSNFKKKQMVKERYHTDKVTYLAWDDVSRFLN